MTTTPEPPAEFVGHGPAAEYLGLTRNTLSSYSSAGLGPKISGRKPRGQYYLPVYKRSDLDAWKASRPGQGARVDLKTKPSTGEAA
jgi:hypothetical protein